MTESKNRQIALFGGSFNPPHLCHTLATLWVLQTQPVDEIWWIPTYQHAFDKELVNYDRRVAMCRKAVADLHRVRIDDIERHLGGESRTIDTVRALKERHVDTDFWLVIGADILDETDRWKNWEGLMDLVRLVVVGREGHGEGKTAGADLELPDISSTLIRESLAGCDYDAIRPWIPRSVLDYISEHDLYLGENCR